MSNMRRLSSGVLLAASALLLSGSASSAWLYASAASGHAFDVSKTLCFFHDEPGRVHYKGSGCDVGSLWHVPIPPLRSPQANSTFYVYAKDDKALVNYCYVTAMSPSGQALRWDAVQLTSVESWHQFDAIDVNATETVVVECELLNSISSGTSWVGSVKFWD